MMRTTKKEFKNQVQEHILNSVLNEEYGETTQEQLKAVAESFNNWYGPYEKKRTPNKYHALTEWGLGLPSEFNIEYRHFAIEENVKNWFSSCGEEYKEPKDETKTYDLYYHLVNREFSDLCKKNNVDF
jgi:hypothetical protein